ncbi:ABC transporter substrate-binding protein [Vagococcus sp. BWB3-3]|uniref:ABC transporter substrate-binding protein n=1 Tax=Vagococcus allomyrinae TaxID=2794353 RepID=A0A940SUR2_9ENTE|nr:ABC transporter substrate-binding protein [Vagococcus allomyrinae]MBP1041084.1 ABC transporter substrate-binding protein [Vagococcus allomyrinae]
MKKHQWLIMIIAVVVGVVGSSCGSQPKNESSQDEVVEISFWHVFSENFGAPVIKEMVTAFNDSQDKINVTEVYNPDMYPGLMQNLQAEVAAGEAPSIAMIGYNYLKYFAANFEYIDPKTLIAEQVPDDQGYLSETFLPNILSLAQVDGEQIGLPYAISTPIIYYNADLFKAAGLDSEQPPTTWQEVRQMAQVISDKTGEYGFYMQEYADNWAVQGLLESNGAEMLKNGKATFASQEAIQAYELFADMVLKDKTALHIGADEGIQAFSNGKVGIFLGTSAKIDTIQSTVEFELKGAEFPIFSGKERRIPAGGNFLPILAKEPAEQQAAWEFIKFMMEPEWLAKWSKNTGYLPPREDVAKDPNGLQNYLKENQLFGIAYEELAEIYPWAAFPDDVGAQAEQIFANTRDQILEGTVSVEKALKDAEKEINQLMD